MIAFKEGEKVSETFNTLMSHLNNAQSVRLSTEAMNALEIVKNEIENVVLVNIQQGEPCPICKTTLEWESTGECDNCGYDKP